VNGFVQVAKLTMIEMRMQHEIFGKRV